MEVGYFEPTGGWWGLNGSSVADGRSISGERLRMFYNIVYQHVTMIPMVVIYCYKHHSIYYKGSCCLNGA
ncbi:hypothetical protein [Pasteuria penetrans]|uniref:hypothetical protein n=1 Tax=Pasteuria penetrans TaxID=86005 RepID=UPI0011EF6D72|nr:hypothetical protein [Pasteuria penetrans]